MAIDRFKIEHSDDEKGPGTFPEFRHLGPDDSREFRRRIAAALGLPSDASGEKLEREAFDRASHIKGWNAKDDSFDLARLFASVGVDPCEQLYIDWRGFYDIDEMKTRDVCTFFDDIWYPGPDDIQIFDLSLTWILTVDHEGMLHMLKL